VVVGGANFFKREEVRVAMAYLTLCVQPFDGLAFERAASPSGNPGEANALGGGRGWWRLRGGWRLEGGLLLRASNTAFTHKSPFRNEVCVSLLLCEFCELVEAT